MYWMLLPLDANAARQLSTEAELPIGTWTHWFRVSWTTIVQVIRGPSD